MTFETGGELVVLNHNNKRRGVFRREDPNADSERLFALDDDSPVSGGQAIGR